MPCRPIPSLCLELLSLAMLGIFLWNLQPDLSWSELVAGEGMNKLFESISETPLSVAVVQHLTKIQQLSDAYGYRSTFR